VPGEGRRAEGAQPAVRSVAWQALSAQERPVAREEAGRAAARPAAPAGMSVPRWGPRNAA